MAFHVGLLVPAGDLSRFRVGRAVSGAHGFWVGQSLTFLLARCLVRAASFHLPTRSGVASQVVRVPVNVSPYAKTLLLAVQLHAGSAAADSATVGVSGASFVTGDDGGMDGATALMCPDPSFRAHPFHVGWLDTSALASGTTSDIVITYTQVSGGNGLRRVHLLECPLATVNPESFAASEAGFAAAWPGAEQPLNAGTASTARGWVRVFDQLDKARYQVRHHLLGLATEESTTAAWQRAYSGGAMGALTWTGMSGAHDPVFRVRPRAIYGTSTSNAHTLSIRYRMDAGTTTAKFRVSVTPVGGGAATTDLTLGTGTTTWTTDRTLALSIPTSGTGGEVDISFAAQITSGAGTLYLDQIAITENET